MKAVQYNIVIYINRVHSTELLHSLGSGRHCDVSHCTVYTTERRYFSLPRKISKRSLMPKWLTKRIHFIVKQSRKEPGYSLDYSTVMSSIDKLIATRISEIAEWTLKIWSVKSEGAGKTKGIMRQTPRTRLSGLVSARSATTQFRVPLGQ